MAIILVQFLPSFQPSVSPSSVKLLTEELESKDPFILRESLHGFAPMRFRKSAIIDGKNDMLYKVIDKEESNYHERVGIVKHAEH